VLLLPGILISLGFFISVSDSHGYRQGGVARDVEKVAVVAEMSVGVDAQVGLILQG